MSKAVMVSERLYKVLIYAVTTSFLFLILKNSNYLHVYIMGDQQEPQYFTQYPCQKLPNYLDDFYIMKLTYHTYELAYAVMFHRGRRDFPEYVFHHLLTLILIMFSYCINFLPIGAVIMLLHDISDLCACIFKICVDTTGATVELSSFALMASTWGYFRILFFPTVIKEYWHQSEKMNHPV